MGNEGHDDQQNMKLKMKLVVMVILTNLLTIFIFLHSNSNNGGHIFSMKSRHHDHHSKNGEDANNMMIGQLQQRLDSTNMLVQALLIELSTRLGQQQEDNKNTHNYNIYDDDMINSNSESELKVGVGPHKLPYGYSERIGSDEIEMPIGAACLSSVSLRQELKQFMSYKIGAECPLDDFFAQSLMLRGCNPLPRRRCRPKSPTTTKAFRQEDNITISGEVEQVLSTKPPGTIRIGVDLTGGATAGSFAGRMREKNVTIVTTALNIDGAPSSAVIASKGLIPIHVSMFSRLPFFENTLDLVHSGAKGLGNWMPKRVMEFAVYDIYRVLRPGGLFWIRNFFCFSSQINQTYSLFLNEVGFNQIRWHTAKSPNHNNGCYISAILEKPEYHTPN